MAPKKKKHGGKFRIHEKAVAAAAAAAPVIQKPPKFYPADEIKKPLSNKRKPRPTKLSEYYTRDGVDHSGRKVSGKRVIFLKKLTSRLLPVTDKSSVVLCGL
ncbi:hypothetical protein OROGR_000703 [Orobanche gracilis]